jgi:hypothetical protein
MGTKSLMKVTAITRKAVVHEENVTIYQLFVTKPAKEEGSEPETIALSTKIEKVTAPAVVVGGAGRRPIEQYSFKVGHRIVLRFGDATALVAKKHNLDLNGVKNPPTYVTEAAKMLRGEKEIRFVDEDTIGQNPLAEATEEQAAAVVAELETPATEAPAVEVVTAETAELELA